MPWSNAWRVTAQLQQQTQRRRMLAPTHCSRCRSRRSATLLLLLLQLQEPL